jgi:D-alanine-D-alanine ligase
MEIECSVLGNESPKASVIGRITPSTASFYDYTAKYIDDNGAELEIPANITPEAVQAARAVALKAYTVLECEGLSRVDMFLTSDSTILVNEINTLPGFTNISMYPKLWEASGVTYTELITELIDLAVQRHTKKSGLRTTP